MVSSVWLYRYSGSSHQRPFHGQHKWYILLSCCPRLRIQPGCSSVICPGSSGHLPSPHGLGKWLLGWRALSPSEELRWGWLMWSSTHLPCSTCRWLWQLFPVIRNHHTADQLFFSLRKELVKVLAFFFPFVLFSFQKSLFVLNSYTFVFSIHWSYFLLMQLPKHWENQEATRDAHSMLQMAVTFWEQAQKFLKIQL